MNLSSQSSIVWEMGLLPSPACAKMWTKYRIVSHRRDEISYGIAIVVYRCDGISYRIVFVQHTIPIRRAIHKRRLTDSSNGRSAQTGAKDGNGAPKGGVPQGIPKEP